MLNEGFDLRDSGCSNGEDNLLLPRHRWYVMKESFSPRILRRAAELHDFAHGTVFDPFSGSGTIPLAAKELGLSGIGVEVNPFLAFVGRTKTVNVSRDSVEVVLPAVFRGIKVGARSNLERLSTFSSVGGAEKWLFNQTVLRGFEGGWRATTQMSPHHRDLVRLALIAATMDTCNAVPDGKCLRYRKQWRELGFNRADLMRHFEQRMAVICEDLAVDPGRGRAEILNEDSRAFVSDSQKVIPFDFCVTSPPYLNSFDYSDVYRPELFLGKFVDSNESLRKVRLRTIRSHVQVEWRLPTGGDFGHLYTDRIAQLQERRELLWSQKIPVMIQAYFEDMNHMLIHLRRHCREGARLWIVVSTSAYAGVEIPVDLILADIGSRAGWYLREVGVLRYLRTSGQHASRHADSAPQLRESVVMLDSSRPRRLSGWKPLIH